MVGVPIAKGTLGEDGDVGENVEESQASPHVCCCPQIVGAKKRYRGSICDHFLLQPPKDHNESEEKSNCNEDDRIVLPHGCHHSYAANPVKTLSLFSSK